MLRKTKIVATIGPATSSIENMTNILEAGVDICRVNCSHCSPEQIRSTISTIRRAANHLQRSVGVLLDLQGPKIRTGVIEPPLNLNKEDVLTVVMDQNYKPTNDEGKERFIGTTWPTMVNDVAVGERVLFADGALSGTVSGIRTKEEGTSGFAEIDITMINGGELKSRKGINLPESNIKAPALTPKDEADLITGVRAGADYVALSFVRHAEDMRIIKNQLSALGQPNLPVIAKIEKPQAVENIEEILDLAEGIMVARGDLGVEIPIAQVPVVQKSLIKSASKKGRLVITATQMLESMTHNPFPTRAEVTDVANAILDGSDAVMLSGETSVGVNPALTVETMSQIAIETEQGAQASYLPIDQIEPLQGKYMSVVRAACYIARNGNRPLVVFTWSGRTAILAAKTRPKCPIFAISPNVQVVDQLRLAWGVHALLVPQIASTEEMIIAAEQALMESDLAKEGDEVLILGGNTPLRGASNLLKIEIVNGHID
ncbi:MAG: pyruvate kinase [Proteobacteria bacterium]|nr:pyruvate kinase [Pseudomonadota bacterium]